MMRITGVGYSLSSTGEKDAMQWLEPFATDNVVRLENATVKVRKINWVLWAW
uniref:Uncharacterized protein n=1 Tax=Actinobacillus pleuropneumoniae TaxID=715 RepID=A0A5B8H3H7_ACTPL|nr:hypothetical protein [Actinobacillus pleuropneumoniae]